MDRYVIPGKLDEPERIGLWTMDEFVAMAGPFVIGILTQHILFGIVFGTLGWWVLRKAKAGRAGSWLLHMAY
ncbi:MAG TPA: type IV conjugative transfer system protein TraL, partial [Sphingobium sp.]|uniref:type IV conjugative transfer system protein TraL n=1 Tax=Sphingobium sp. TaxID=1912891 RepID=UPI002ED068A2